MSFVLFEKDGALRTQPDDREDDSEVEVIIKRGARVVWEGSEAWNSDVGARKVGVARRRKQAEVPAEDRDAYEERASASARAAGYQVAIFGTGRAVVLDDEVVQTRRQRTP